MYQTIAEQAFYRLLATTLLFLAGAGSACADSLSVNEAEQLALKGDYTLMAINARSQSMSELSVATEKLPDPKLKLGFANLPTCNRESLWRDCEEGGPRCWLC